MIPWIKKKLGSSLSDEIKTSEHSKPRLFDPRARKKRRTSSTKVLIERFNFVDSQGHTPDVVEKEERLACRECSLQNVKNSKSKFICLDCTAICDEMIYLHLGTCWRNWHTRSHIIERSPSPVPTPPRRSPRRKIMSPRAQRAARRAKTD